MKLLDDAPRQVMHQGRLKYRAGESYYNDPEDAALAQAVVLREEQAQAALKSVCLQWSKSLAEAGMQCRRAGWALAEQLMPVTHAQLEALEHSAVRRGVSVVIEDGKHYIQSTNIDAMAALLGCKRWLSQAIDNEEQRVFVVDRTAKGSKLPVKISFTPDGECLGSYIVRATFYVKVDFPSAEVKAAKAAAAKAAAEIAAATEYTFDRVLGCRQRDGRAQALLGWAGCPDTQNSWEPGVTKEQVLGVWNGARAVIGRWIRVKLHEGWYKGKLVRQRAGRHYIEYEHPDDTDSGWYDLVNGHLEWQFCEAPVARAFTSSSRPPDMLPRRLRKRKRPDAHD